MPDPRWLLMPGLRPLRFRVAWSLVSALALPLRLNAQADSDPRPLATRDTITLTLGLRFPTDLPVPGDLRGPFLSLARSIALEFQSPRPWRLPLWPGTYTADTIPWLRPESAGLAIGAEGDLVFRLSKTGQVEAAECTAPRGAPGLGEALTEALRRADSLGELSVPDLTGRTIRDTTVVLEVGSSLESTLGLVPIARLRLPALKADAPPILVAIRSPEYPADLAQRGLGGGVIAQYVIDEKGCADLETLEFLLSDDARLSRAVLEALKTARFHPAAAHGTPVRFLVRQSFHFRTR